MDIREIGSGMRLTWTREAVEAAAAKKGTPAASLVVDGDTLIVDKTIDDRVLVKSDALEGLYPPFIVDVRDVRQK